MVEESPDLTGASQATQSLRHAVEEKTSLLTTEQRSRLSKVLFPETHNSTVELCGSKRELRPLPIKITRKINQLLAEFTAMLESPERAKAADMDVLDHMLAVVRHLVVFYGWEDALKEINEENIMLGEMQSLIVEQLELQESSDFLLIPLRALIGVQQQVEIDQIRLQSIYTGLPS